MASRMISEETPAGAALLLAYEMHERHRISVVELRAFEAALREPASREEANLVRGLPLDTVRCRRA